MSDSQTPQSDAVTTQPTGTTNTPVATPPALDTVPVDALAHGHCGLVCQIEAEDIDLDRLKAMGICVGRRLFMVKNADPLIVRVYGTRIGLSRRLARFITVMPTEKEVCCQTRAASDAATPSPQTASTEA